MPKYVPSGTWPPFVAWMLMFLLLGALLRGIWEEPIILLLLAAAGLFGTIQERRRRIRLTRLSEERRELSICEFARSLDYRRIDTWIIRAVYEAIQNHVSAPETRVPIKAEDHLYDVLEIDDEDLDMDLVAEILQRTGRSMEDTPGNPYYGKVETVADLLHFINAQPLVANT